jgi:DNA-binding transcriptional ArsR family regulator
MDGFPRLFVTDLDTAPVTPRRKGRTPRPPIDHPARADISVQGILEALVDPLRRDIVLRLAASDVPMRCGAFDAPVSLSTLTHHFHVLREAGLVRQFYEGTAKLNELRADDVEAVAPGLLGAINGAVR